MGDRTIKVLAERDPGALPWGDLGVDIVRVHRRPHRRREGIVGDPASCVLDAALTRVSGPRVKVVGWHDNEWGRSNRLVDLALPVGPSP